MPQERTSYLKIPRVANPRGVAKVSDLLELASAVEAALLKIHIISAAGYTVREAVGGTVLTLASHGQTESTSPGTSYNPNGGNAVDGSGDGGTGSSDPANGAPDGTPNYDISDDVNDPTEDPTFILSNTVSQTLEVSELSYDSNITIPTEQGAGNGEPGSLDGCVLASTLGVIYPPANWRFQPELSYPNTSYCKYERHRTDTYQISVLTVIENQATPLEPGEVGHVTVPGFGLFKGEVLEVNSVRTDTVPPKYKTTYKLKRWVSGTLG